jgi:hypothetical protein
MNMQLKTTKTRIQQHSFVEKNPCNRQMLKECKVADVSTVFSVPLHAMEALVGGGV